ncbi:MAG: hypothetical protein AVDCRST_MAG57-2425, partial [uncultured Blastococcus sp.]
AHGRRHLLRPGRHRCHGRRGGRAGTAPPA